MRNPVAKHNHNRPATHPDRSKEPQNTLAEGLLDYYAENAENVAQEEYGRVIGMTPDDSKIVPMTPGDIYDPKYLKVVINGKEIDTVEQFRKVLNSSTQRKIFPGLAFPVSKKIGLDLKPVSTPEELDQLFLSFEYPPPSIV